MKILVTGREGQVARSLIERSLVHADVEIVAIGRPDFDLSDPASVLREIPRHKPDIVVSAAAYTAVDRAEDDSDMAMAVNAGGAGAVAEAAARVGAPVIHLSTDYVFSGESRTPYTEMDSPAPRTVYGRSKLSGEQAVAAANPDHVILRTAWLYSPYGRNFIKTMLDLARSRAEIDVVSDQFGNPTSALDIADGIIHVARMLGGTDRQFGVFHMAAAGHTSWSGFAEHVFAVSRKIGGPSARVRPVPSSTFPTRASRPLNSCLDTDALFRAYRWHAPDWRVSSESTIRRLLQAAEESK